MKENTVRTAIVRTEDMVKITSIDQWQTRCIGPFGNWVVNRVRLHDTQDYDDIKITTFGGSEKTLHQIW